jgi:hypothetical protein
MKKNAIAALILILNACLVFSAQETTVSVKNVAQDIPATSVTVKDTVVHVKKDSAASSYNHDSVTINNKVAAPNKVILEEEEMLIDESEEKKQQDKVVEPENPLSDSANRQQAITSGTDSNNASPSDVAAPSAVPDSQKNIKSVPEISKKLPALDTANVKSASQTEKRATVVRPVTVENIHSINFAKNLKDYKSPKLAMLMSLLVPGLGQVYVKRYYKAGIFFALEATSIGFNVYFNNLGKKKLKDAHTFADKNYNDSLMLQYYKNLFNLFSEQEGPDTAQTYMDEIYPDSLNSFVKGSQDYYNSIKSGSYVQGWNDCEPSGNTILTSTTDTIIVGNNKYCRDTNATYLVYQVDADGNIDTNKAIYGYSANQEKYAEMVSKSNSYYKTAQGILIVMLVNHIVSAVDALISAKAYNDELLGKETLWQHLSVEQQFVKVGTSTAIGCAMRIQF